MKAKPIIEIDDLYDQVKELNQRLYKESDVGGVLLSTSFLDSCLTSLLGVHFIKSRTTKKVLNSTSGVLGTFSSKSDILYCLSLISKETYQDLIAIGQTRNIFAHNHLKASFRDNKVIETCGELNSPNLYLEANKDQSNYEDIKKYFESAKNRFIYTVSTISDLILERILSIRSRYKEKNGEIMDIKK